MNAARSQAGALRLLAGSGRSGTTWLLDVLCEANELHPVFEPLHPSGWNAAALFSRRYAADTWTASDEAAFEAFWNALLEGNYPPTWIDYRVRPDKLMLRPGDLRSLSAFKRRAAHWTKWWRHRSKYARVETSACLIKVIRANLLLPRLARRPDTHYALVVRHPAAVVESQLRLKGDWDPRRIAQRYAEDEVLAARLGEEWRGWIDRLDSEAELLTFIWCLENVLPIEDIDGISERVAFYELLAQIDTAEWGKLLAGLALQTMPDADALRRPSQQSTEALGQSAPGSSSALDRLQVADKAGIQRVLDMVGVHFYHTGSLVPEPQQLMASRPWSAN